MILESEYFVTLIIPNYLLRLLMRKCVKASLVLMVLMSGVLCQAASGSEKSLADKKSIDKDNSTEREITWNKNRKLTWDDFRGPVPHDADDITAAATFCGIGFETNTITSNNNNLKISIYNSFYTGNSWVRPEERNDNILAHEQGHFDLCELYTRKLRERMSNVQVNVKTLKPVLSSIYDQVQQEYRQRQEEYENDTEHGVNLLQQKKWQQMLERELGQTEDWSKS
jgi:hypothetical protein